MAINEPTEESELMDRIHAFDDISQMEDYIKKKYGILDRVYVRGVVVNLGKNPVDLSHTSKNTGIIETLQGATSREEFIVKPIINLLESGTEFDNRPGDKIPTRLISLDPKEPTLYHAQEALDPLRLKMRIAKSDIKPSDEQIADLRTALIVYNPQSAQRFQEAGTWGFEIQSGTSAIIDVLIFEPSHKSP